MHQAAGSYMGRWQMVVLLLPDTFIFTTTTQFMFFSASEPMVDDIGDILKNSGELIVGDPACGTIHWVMGCWEDIVVVLDSVDNDEDGMILLILRLGDVGVK